MQETATKLRLANPYIAGRSLGQDRGFFGREDIIQMVSNDLQSPDRSAVVLFGQRRIGKTSILLQLRRRLTKDGFVPVYFDLMERATAPLGAVLFELAVVIGEQASLPVPKRSDFDEDGLYFRRGFIPRVLSSLQEDSRLVLLLDEFEALDRSADRDLPPASAGRSLLPFLRRLMEAEPRIGFVFLAGRKPEDLSIDGTGSFKSARSKRVAVLDDTSSRDLIRQAEEQGTLAYAPGAIDRILHYTSGHPFATQLLCQVIWDQAHERSKEQAPEVSAQDVDSAIGAALESGNNAFEWIWDELPPAERVALSAIAQSGDSETPVATPAMARALEKQGVRFQTRDLAVAPDTLVRWEMLKQQDDGYRFSVELFRGWVASRKPLARVKDELDRVVPLADTLYQSSEGFYRLGNLENSYSQLQQALTINPNHIKARLLLSQVLMEQGRLSDAVRTLEESYKLDESSSRAPLVRMLLLRLDEMDRSGDDAKSLEVADRLLEVSPQEKIAWERRTSIWKERGDRAFKAEKLDEAEAAYEQIGAAELLDQVAARRRQLQIEALTKQAQSSMDGSRWEQAVDLYQQLSVLEPENQTWTQALEKAGVENRLAKLYAEGREAIRAKNWRKAQASLMDLLRSRPEYKDAPEMLVLALKPPQPPAPAAPLEPKPMLRGWLPLYIKCIIGIAICAAAQLIRIYTGTVGLGTAAGYYLGTALLLGLALALVEFIWERVAGAPTTRS